METVWGPCRCEKVYQVQGLAGFGFLELELPPVQHGVYHGCWLTPNSDCTVCKELWLTGSQLPPGLHHLAWDSLPCTSDEVSAADKEFLSQVPVWLMFSSLQCCP